MSGGYLSEAWGVAADYFNEPPRTRFTRNGMSMETYYDSQYSKRIKDEPQRTFEGNHPTVTVAVRRAIQAKRQRLSRAGHYGATEELREYLVGEKNAGRMSTEEMKSRWIAAQTQWSATT